MALGLPQRRADQAWQGLKMQTGPFYGRTMDGSPSRQPLGFDPSAIRRWIGPQPDGEHARLLMACLGEPEAAVQAWNTWVSRTDFDHEHGASHELAALAVQRLGAAAGSGSMANRSRGLARRAWSLSVLALDAAAQIGDFCRSHTLQAVAIADLATHGGRARFAGQPFPVRALELLLPGVECRLLASWLEGGLSGASAAAYRNRSFAIRLHPFRRRDGTTTVLETCTPANQPGFRLPETAAHLELLVAMNWRRHPPGGLRWLVELIAGFRSVPDPVALARSVVARSQRRATTVALREAVDVAAALPGGDALIPLRQVLAETPDSPRARLLHRAKRASWPGFRSCL